MTEDVIHVFQSLNSILQVFKSSIYSVLDRAILANLQHRPLKLGRLIHVVLQEAHLWNRYKKLCSHGNSLFSSPHPLDFKMSVIFSSKNIKSGHKLKLSHLYNYMLAGSCISGTISKYQNRMPKVARKAFYWGGLEPTMLLW